MYNPKVTVVLPTYNVEKYLNRCIYIGPYLSFTIATLKQESIRKPIGNEQIREIINDKVFYELICKKYKQNFMRRIFIWVAKKKYVALCELLLIFQTRR